MTSNKPLISIIIINYNQTKVTCEFIESTQCLMYPRYEIIMIDNNSDEDPTPVVSSRFPHVKIIRNEKNTGFTGGNNTGIQAAKGEYYFIVNNDTEVTPYLLDELIEPFFDNDQIGVVSPKIRYFSHPRIIQYAGFTEVNPFTGRNKSIGLKEEDNGQYDVPCYTAYAHGAAMMVKKEVVEKVGSLSDIFFIYYEELDWSARIRQAGYKIFYQPTALIYHKESITMGKESPMKAYFHNRNRILFMRRNTTGFQFSIFIIFFIFVVIPKSIITYLSKGQFLHLRNFFRSLAWNLTTPKFIIVETKTIGI